MQDRIPERLAEMILGLVRSPYLQLLQASLRPEFAEHPEVVHAFRVVLGNLPQGTLSTYKEMEKLLGVPPENAVLEDILVALRKTNRSGLEAAKREAQIRAQMFSEAFPHHASKIQLEVSNLVAGRVFFNPHPSGCPCSGCGQARYYASKGGR